MGAAEAAMTDKRFYSIRLRSFAAPMSNVDESPQEPFNDLQALVIGIIRDDLDARLMLSGDFGYKGYPNLGLPAVSRADNAHYQEFESRGYDYWRDLMRYKDQWPDIDEAAGVLTSRAWGKAFLSAGTNRRSMQYSFQIFMCAPKEKWKDVGIPDHFVRRDVNRNIGGNPWTYQNDCRNCHGIMDALTGAFARFDFVDNAITYMGPSGIAAKYNQNGEVFPDGYVTYKDAWINYATYNTNKGFGWRGPLKGIGVKAYGEMLANSRGFSQCMVKRVFHDVCNRDLEGTESEMVESLADKFEGSGYRFKTLFAAAAIEPNCIAHPSRKGAIQ